MINKNNLLSVFKNSQNNPYVFSKHSIIEEPKEKKQEKYELSKKELEIVREQHLTIFENDEIMRKMFKNDFKEYFKAVEDPDLMEKKYKERMKDLNGASEGSVIEIDDLSNIMPAEEDDEFWDSMGGFDEFEMGLEDDFGISLSSKKDELYEKTFKWSVDMHKLCYLIYEDKNKRDSDLFRAMINSTMVSAKVAYASDDNDSFFDDLEKDEEFEAFEAQLSLKGYTMAVIFLQRVRDSLIKLIKKNFTPISEWKDFLKVADELVLEIQTRMLELTKRLHPPRN